MGNPKMRTKPIVVVPEKMVRNYVANVLRPSYHAKRDVNFCEVWIWEERPTFTDPYYRKVTFHGRTRFSAGWAEYEGEFGKWMIHLDSQHDKYPCTTVYGAPECIEASNEWCETQEQKRERLMRLFKIYPFNELPHKNYSWTKVS